ncbi:MAG: SCO family protein [Hahellaceae bacterium]|nr:SCO family protein [Hahellaceae bacterium]MCP5210089.1 SCO family protein [Hahellaceae bacterium]
MNGRLIYVFGFIIALIALGMGWYTGKVSLTQALDKKTLEEVGAFVYDVPRPVTEFSLVDQHGQAFNNSRLLGKWSFVFFGYTHCPDVCPGTMLVYQALNAEFSDRGITDTQMLMVTVDPARDNVETLQGYLAFFNPEYIGLTGEEAVIRRFAQSLNAGFSIPEHAEGEPYFVDHSSHIALVDPDGNFAGFFQMPHKAAVIATILNALRH